MNQIKFWSFIGARDIGFKKLSESERAWFRRRRRASSRTERRFPERGRSDLPSSARLRRNASPLDAGEIDRVFLRPISRASHHHPAPRIHL